MPTRARIIAALQFTHIQSALPMNSTGDGRYEISYQFAGNRQPGDALWSYSGWTAFTFQQKQAIRAALAQIETFLNIDFVEVTTQADPNLTIGRVNLGPGIVGEGGCQVSGFGAGARWDAQVVYDRQFSLTGPRGMNVILHEIGHALGLDHPFQGTTLPPAFENNHFTVMSYSIDPISHHYNNAMMLYDLLALQDIWGSAPYHGGNSTYTGRDGFDLRVIWDTGGTDTLSARGIDHGVRLDLQQGHFSRFGGYQDVAIAYGVRIERAIGSDFRDTIIGNATANYLAGRGGRDTMSGNAGNDRLHGQGANDTLRGGAGSDRLYGGSGNDVLMSQAGNDRMVGGAGADTFVFARGNGHDQVMDFADNVDSLRILGRGGLTNVLAHGAEVAGDVVFSFAGGDQLTVHNMTLAALHDDILVA